MKTPNEKTIQEIKNLLLNKSVKWYYFETDLNEVVDASKSKHEPFLVPTQTDEFLSKVNVSESVESVNDPQLHGKILRSASSYQTNNYARR